MTWQATTWIHPLELPTGKKAIYFNPRCKLRYLNGRPSPRVRGTAGGNQSDYDGPKTAFTGDLQKFKILLNSVASEPDAEWSTADRSDFYLGTNLESPEYIWIHKSQLPQRTLCRFEGLIHFQGDRALVRIYKSIYGLPQAGCIEQQALYKHLRAHGYRPTKYTPCLWTHIHNNILFEIVVDEFGIKWRSRASFDHLLHTLRTRYRITFDPSGSKYLAIPINRHPVSRAIRSQSPITSIRP